MRHEKVPGPKGHPLWGSIRELNGDTADFLVRSQREYGDLLRLRLGPIEAYVLCAPEMAEQALITDTQRIVKLYELKPNAGIALSAGKGLITSTGELWRSQRNLINPMFRRKLLGDQFDVMAGYGAELLSRLEAHARDGSIVDMRDEARLTTQSVAMATLFGVTDAIAAADMSEAIHSVLRYCFEATKNPFLPPLIVPTARNRRFKRELKHVDDYVQLLIDKRLETKSDKVDFLSLLLEARDEKTGDPLPQKQVRDETITMFAAGQETTANTFTFALAHISRRPDVAERIRREVADVVGSEKLNLGHLQRLSYISAVIHEVTRLYPGVPLVPRVVKTETTIGGYRIPARSPLFISLYNIHRNLAHWPDPHTFDPERFTRPDTHRARCAFMPFGAGERFCIGNNFAALELAILLAMAVPVFDFSLAANMPRPSISITMRPDGPVPMRVQRTTARANDLATAIHLS